MALRLTWLGRPDPGGRANTGALKWALKQSNRGGGFMVNKIETTLERKAEKSKKSKKNKSDSAFNFYRLFTLSAKGGGIIVKDCLRGVSLDPSLDSRSIRLEQNRNES
jgi:hypothetical protein